MSPRQVAPAGEPDTYIEADEAEAEQEAAAAKGQAIPEAALGKKLAHADKKVRGGGAGTHRRRIREGAAFSGARDVGKGAHGASLHIFNLA